MEKGKIVGLAVAGSMAATGYLGYRAGETWHDTPQQEVAVAAAELDVAAQSYQELASTGSCEADVLATMFHINAYNTPRSADLTTQAFENVCGQNVQYHADLGEQASQSFRAYISAQEHFNDVEDTASYSWEEKVGAAAIGGLGPAAVVLFGICVVGLAQERRASQKTKRQYEAMHA